tara:strand:+ start:684 stop:1700 length:1017 start_codon:yes stop_codon:yes gene_type:complete
MAVYTELSNSDIEIFLKDYDLGKLIKFIPIIEGVENTNYKIITSKRIFILTIFEERVSENDLPFFIELQHHLSKKNIKCPQPIANKSKSYINTIKNKKCVLMSFLDGKKLKDPKNLHCYQLGHEISKMHMYTKDFSLNRNNNLNHLSWKNLYEKCKKLSSFNPKFKKLYTNYKYENKKINNDNELFNIIEDELAFLEEKWPKNLPLGVIHADMFQDNVFFINDNLSAIIDFYFSCNDYYAYELAICINAWCFDLKNFNNTKFKSIIEGYESIRKLDYSEKTSLPILLRGAAMRFFLTRFHDQIYQKNKAIVIQKDPKEYFEILFFHKNFQKNNFKYGS